jgi:hypothetical protein
VKELELEARKVAALEQQVKLQERRIEVEAMKARAVLGRVKGEVIESKALKKGDGGEERKVAQIGIGSENGVGAAAPSPRPSPTEGEGEGKSGQCPSEGAATGEHGDLADHSQRTELEVQAGLASGPSSIQRFAGLVEEALGILNRGGDPGERIIESRALLEEAIAGLRNG